MSVKKKDVKNLLLPDWPPANVQRVEEPHHTSRDLLLCQFVLGTRKAHAYPCMLRRAITSAALVCTPVQGLAHHVSFRSMGSHTAMIP